MVVFFHPQGLNIVEFHAVYFLTKWHLGFTKTLRRFRGRELSGLHMWDQEEGCGEFGSVSFRQTKDSTNIDQSVYPRSAKISLLLQVDWGQVPTCC